MVAASEGVAPWRHQRGRDLIQRSNLVVATGTKARKVGEVVGVGVEGGTGKDRGRFDERGGGDRGVREGSAMAEEERKRSGPKIESGCSKGDKSAKASEVAGLGVGGWVAGRDRGGG